MAAVAERYKAWDRDEVDAILEDRRIKLGMAMTDPADLVRRQCRHHRTEADEDEDEVNNGGGSGVELCVGHTAKGKDEIVRGRRRRSEPPRGDKKAEDEDEDGDGDDEEAQRKQRSKKGIRRSSASISRRQSNTIDSSELHSPTPYRRVVECTATPLQRPYDLRKSQDAIKGWSPLPLRRKRRITATKSADDLRLHGDADVIINTTGSDHTAAVLSKKERQREKATRVRVSTTTTKQQQLDHDATMTVTDEEATAATGECVPRHRHSWHERIERRRTGKGKTLKKDKDARPSSRVVIHPSPPSSLSSSSEFSVDCETVSASGAVEKQHRRRPSLGAMVPMLFGSLSTSFALMRSSRPAPTTSPTSPSPAAASSSSSPASPLASRRPSVSSSSTCSSSSLSSLLSSSFSLSTTEREQTELIGSGDVRLYCLLRELQLVKYWPHFLTQEILLDDLSAMNEEELTNDFHLTKYHARRLAKALQQNEASRRALMPLPSDHGADAEVRPSVSSSSSPCVAQEKQRRAFATGDDQAEDTEKPRSNSTSIPLRSVRIARKRSKSAIDRIVPWRSTKTVEDAVVSTTSSQRGDNQSLSEETRPTTMTMVKLRLEERRNKNKSEGRESGDQELVVSDAIRKKRWTITHGKGRKSDSAPVSAVIDVRPSKPPSQQQESAQQRGALERRRRDSEEDHRLDALVRKHRELAIEELEWDEEKGIVSSGMFGRVYKGKWRGVDCAIKQLKLMPTDDPAQRALVIKEFRREAALMQALGHHPNCSSKLCLVTEWVKNGSVYDLLIKKKTELPLEIIVKLARDAACGILHLHSENVIHRDIAARNVLVGENYTGKISDLGLSRMVAGVTASLRNYTNSSVGAVKWMSPESIHSGTYSEKTDAYSFGVFLWEMWTRQQPWDDLPPLQAALRMSSTSLTAATLGRHQIAGGGKLAIPEDCPRGLADVISQCLSTDPDDRPNFSAIVQALDALLTRLPPPVSPVAPSQCTRGDCAAPGTAEDSESRQSRWRQLLQFDEEEEAAAASSDSSSNDDADEEGDEEDTSSDSDQEDEALRLMHYNLDMASLRRIRANACG